MVKDRKEEYTESESEPITDTTSSYMEENININAIDIDICNTRSSTSIPTDIMVSEYVDESKQDCKNADLNTIQNTVKTEFDPDNVRGQIDTGAKVSCTNMLFLLHDYRAYTGKRPSGI